MALPIKEKTWLYSVNQTVGAVSSVPPDNQDYLFKLKQSLIGFATSPWTVWGSSDGTSFDAGGGTDYWVTSSNLVWATGSHSWIVLTQAGIGANAALLIDLNTSSNYRFTLKFSATGFSGGSLTAAPTAADAITLKFNSDHGGSNVGWTGKLHVWQSSDGECTRWALMRDGTLRAIAIFDKPKDPIAAWLNPFIGGFVATYNGSGYASYGTWNDNANLRSRISPVTAQMYMYLTCEGWVSGAGGQNFTVADEDTGEWPMMPIALASVTAAHRGARKGAIYDLWWGPTALVNGDTFPDDASKQFVIFDDMIFPWNGSVPLLA